MTLTQKIFDTELKAEPGERTVVAQISTTAVDRDGDVMLPSGVDMTDFKRNPVVLFGHDAGRIPIGKAEGMRRHRNALEAKVRFADRPDSLPESQEWPPDTVFSLFQQGVLRAFSVGFTIDNSREADQKDAELFGEGVRRVITNWKLLEFSVVPIPANQDALAVAVSKGILRGDSWTAHELDRVWEFTDPRPKRDDRSRRLEVVTSSKRIQMPKPKRISI